MLPLQALYKLDCTKKPGNADVCPWTEDLKSNYDFTYKKMSVLQTLQIFFNFSTDFNIYLFINQANTYMTYQMLRTFHETENYVI